MYAALFGITQDLSGNPFLVIKFVPLSLGCNFVSSAINITGPLTPDALPTRRTVIENLELLQFFNGGVYLWSQEPLTHSNYKGSRFHPNSIGSNEKNEKIIMRWVCLLQILPLRLNHHVTTLLLWHTNLWILRSRRLRFNHLPMPLRIWQPLLPNKVIQVILFLDIRTGLSYVWYRLYHLPPWHPKVRCVSCNNYIFNILYLIFRYQRMLYRGEVFSNVIGLLKILCKQLVTVILGTGSISHTPLNTGFLSLSRSFLSIDRFSSFHHKVLIWFTAGSYNSLVTVAVSWSDELSYPDFVGTNSQ